jgi:hypothetical protein
VPVGRDRGQRPVAAAAVAAVPGDLGRPRPRPRVTRRLGRRPAPPPGFNHTGPGITPRSVEAPSNALSTLSINATSTGTSSYATGGAQCRMSKPAGVLARAVPAPGGPVAGRDGHFDTRHSAPLSPLPLRGQGIVSRDSVEMGFDGVSTLRGPPEPAATWQGPGAGIGDEVKSARSGVGGDTGRPEIRGRPAALACCHGKPFLRVVRILRRTRPGDSTDTRGRDGIAANAG